MYIAHILTFLAIPPPSPPPPLEDYHPLLLPALYQNVEYCLCCYERQLQKKKPNSGFSAPLVKLQSVFFSQSLLHSWQGQEMGVKLFSDNDTAGDRDVPNFTIGPWHFKEQGQSRLSSYICYAGQTLHEGNSCTTGLCWAKHHRIVGASRSTVEQVHVTTATAKETSRTGFQLAGRDNYRPWLLRKNSANFASTKAGESEDAVSRVLRCENFLKAFGQGVIPCVANTRNLQTGQLTALRR